MKTSGASRKKPSQSPPGSAHAAVSQPPPCSPPSVAAPSAPSRRCSSASVSSSSATSSCGVGSRPEELAIPLLPPDPDRVAFAPAECRVAVARHLGEHALAADGEGELDEVAEELDKEDLAMRGVRHGGRGTVVDLDGRGADRDERLVADGAGVAGGEYARAHVAVTGDHEAVAAALDHVPADDVVVAHEARDELGLGPGCDRQW